MTLTASLRYRPNKFDDWGIIRDSDGKLFASVRRPASEEELAAHREAGTDPFEDLARRLIDSYSSPAPQPLLVGSQIATAVALKLAIEHIEHMAAFIGSKQLGYSFESLGEDMPGMKSALADNPPVDFPYQQTFNAIAAATSLGAKGITSINISVQAFQDAWNAAARSAMDGTKSGYKSDLHPGYEPAGDAE